MTVSAAKLEANRRNAMQSCGPRTQSGKDRSKLNAVKHGMRAATLVLLDEDADALAERRADWAAGLMPRGAAEQQIVDDAVEYSWLRDRARRAQEARLAANIVNSGVDEAIREADEVLRLGQKLFSDHRGSLANYPHYDREDDEFPENVPVVSESEILDGDPEDPQRLVGRLQTTAGGCQWMLDRWAELRSILEEGLDWQSADKLKAVRLLGRHPIEAVDDRNVLMIFVACQMIESRTSVPIPEIWFELRAIRRKALRPAPDRAGNRKAQAQGCQQPRARPFTPSSTARRPRLQPRPRCIAPAPRSMTPWPPTDWHLTIARKESACAASTWRAAGAWHARSTRCSSSDGRVDELSFVR